ncbi:hypothetical protein GCM10020000_13970 [Streptomyces olivoverticillatus]
MALSPDELRLYVANYRNGKVSVLRRASPEGAWAWHMDIDKDPRMVRPYGLALSPQGTTLYVSSAAGDKGTVEVFAVSADAATHRRTIAVKDEALVPPGLALSPDGRFLYAAVSEKNRAMMTRRWARCTASSWMQKAPRCEPSRRPPKRTPTGPPGSSARTTAPCASSTRGGRMPPVREACRAIITLDTTRLSVSGTKKLPLDKNDEPYSAAVSDDGTLCVANFTSGTVTVFGSQVTPVPVGEPGASQPWDVAVTDDGAYAYVTDRTADSLRCVRLSDRQVTSLDVGRDPMGVTSAPGGGLRAYVANHGSNSISVIGPDDTSPGTPKVVVTWPLPGITKPESVSVSADGAWLFVTTENSGELLMLDTRTGTPRFTVPARRTAHRQRTSPAVREAPGVPRRRGGRGRIGGRHHDARSPGHDDPAGARRTAGGRPADDELTVPTAPTPPARTEAHK